MDARAVTLFKRVVPGNLSAETSNQPAKRGGDQESNRNDFERLLMLSSLHTSLPESSPLQFCAIERQFCHTSPKSRNPAALPIPDLFDLSQDGLRTIGVM